MAGAIFVSGSDITIEKVLLLNLKSLKNFLPSVPSSNRSFANSRNSSCHEKGSRIVGSQNIPELGGSKVRSMYLSKCFEARTTVNFSRTLSVEMLEKCV